MLILLPTPAAPFTHHASPGLTGRLSMPDHAAVRREGWEVVECGHDPECGARVEIRRVPGMADGSPTFAADHDAWEHVVQQARSGSKLHRAALDAVDDIERMLIEASCGCW